MFCLARQKIYGVRQNRRDDCETFAHGFRRAGQIYNQTTAANAANAARQNRSRRFFHRFKTHRFRQTLRFAFDDGARRFGRRVARRKTRSARRQNQIRVAARRQCEKRKTRIWRCMTATRLNIRRTARERLSTVKLSAKR